MSGPNDRTPAGDGAELAGSKRFQIVRRIGAGGMGVVYEAHDRERDARVALKTLRTWTADAFLRFKGEFRALQDLQHPNLVNLGELLEEDGQWFFTMELIEGVSFLRWVQARDTDDPPSREVSTDRVRRRPPEASVPADGPTADLPAGITAADVSAMSLAAAPGKRVDERRLRASLRQLARGLQALHGARKVHRDIKPSNVLVTRSGQVKILDFGLVSDLGSQAWRDEPPLGTASYMAPEQATTKPVGPAADWYSVGVVLYQALTGRLPFIAPPDRVILLKSSLEPTPPRNLRKGVPPDLDELCVELLRIDPAERPTGTDILRRLGDDEEPTIIVAPGATAEIFVGRQRELETLREAYSDSRKSAVTVLVHGESGVGKSALVHRFADGLLDETDAELFVGRCYERESVPYKAVDGVIDSLSRWLTSLPDDEAAELLGEEPGLLAQVFPVMRRVKVVAQAPPLDAGRDLQPQDLRTRVFAAVRELFARLAARKAVVLAIDDLQWADADSLALLAEILRPPSPPMLLVATLRGALERELRDATRGSEGGTRTIRQLSERLPGDVRQLAVGNFPPEDARRLVDVLLAERGAGAAIDREAIAREAAGHPLFIDELLRGGGGARPVRLEEALWGRIARLDPVARGLLEVVVVAGAPVVQETAASALSMAFGPFVEQIALLRSANLIKTTGARRTDGVEPYHDRVRNAVLMNLPAESLARLHRGLAVALEGSSGADAEALATHWRGAGDPTKAALYATRAAEDAVSALAFERGARLYRLALELHGEGADRMELGRLRAKLGDALTNAGRGAEAAASYLAAAETAGAADALELRRRAADQLLRSGHIDEGLDAIRSVLRAVGMRLPVSPKTALASLLARRMQVRLRGLGFTERAEKDVPADELSRIDVCWSVGAGLGLVDNVRGSYFQSRGLVLALKSGEPFRIARALAGEAAFSSSAGGPSAERTARLLVAAQEIAARSNRPYAVAWATGAAGIAAALEGRWRTALTRCEEGEALFRERCVGVAWELAIMRWFSLWSLAYLGELDELSRRVPARLRDAEGRGDLHAEIGHSTGLANLAWLAADKPDEARRRGDAAMDRWSHKTFHVEHWWNMLGQAQVDLYRGDGAGAHRRVLEQWKGLKSSLLLMVQLTRLEATHLRARAAIAAATSATGAPDRRLLAAAAKDARAIAREDMPWSTPLAHLLDAGIAAAGGDKDRAVTLLQDAAVGLDAAGMRLYATSARYRHGRLLGGDAGRRLVDDAVAWMMKQKIVSPLMMVGMLAPGFPER